MLSASYHGVWPTLWVVNRAVPPYRMAPGVAGGANSLIYNFSDFYLYTYSPE